MIRSETKSDAAAEITHHGQLSLVQDHQEEHQPQDVQESEEVRDCEWDEWGDWTACQFTCGGGTSTRVRQVKTVATVGGAACNNNDKDSRECRNNMCPADCTWNSWGDWSECSVTCGKGSAFQKRTTNPAEYGGLTCQGDWQKVKECALQEQCPVDCTWNEWTEWNGCSKTCGGGSEARVRERTPGNAAGKLCIGNSKDTRECGQNTCPTDCVLGNWSDWSACTTTCGRGDHTRSRSINIPAACGGTTCGTTEETKVCQAVKECPVDCKWTAWSEWNSCTVSCNGGQKTRTRSVEQQAVGDGSPCEGVASDSAECSQRHCPIDCQETDWTQWGSCSVSCGHGIADRSRSMNQATYGGASCSSGGSYQTKPCSAASCPVDCEFTDWAEWDACSATCGFGQSVRVRLVKTIATGGGKECSGDDHQSRECNEQFCPIACSWTAWTEWSTCGKTCGESTQQRSRTVGTLASRGGAECTGPTTGERSCSTQSCPIHCQWLDWQDWSTCAKSCGLRTFDATITRIRDKAQEAQFGGQNCEGNNTQSLPCANLQPCPVDCQWGAWNEWGTCSASCGSGKWTRSRIMRVEATNGGRECLKSGLTDETECMLEECPQDCKMSDWGEWHDCSATCSNGTSDRFRSVRRQAVASGRPCSNFTLRATKNCFLQECAQNCVWADWSNWTACTKSCGGGYSERSRVERIPAVAGGTACDGHDKMESVCSASPCPTDCQWSEWSEWTDCSLSCAGGTRSSWRNQTTVATFGGLDCSGQSKQTEPCSTQACPQDCMWSTWTGWSVCTVTCGGGETRRTRRRGQEASAGGLPCIGVATEEDQCNTSPCPRDCEWGPWSRWSGCTRTCGGGVLKRFREVAIPARYDGNACLGTNIQEAECNANPCSENCEWSDWDEWTDCSVTCDGGYRSKSRVITSEARHHGNPCVGNATDQQQCNLDPCPIDCRWDEWQHWGQCSVSCGDGNRVRSRNKNMQRNGGKSCSGPFSETDVCSNPDNSNCPVTTTTTTIDPLGGRGSSDYWNPASGHGGSTGLQNTLDPNSDFQEKTQTYNAPEVITNVLAPENSTESEPQVQPCAKVTKESLEEAVYHGSIGAGNITAVIDKLLALRSRSNVIKGNNSKSTDRHRFGRRVAVVEGDLRLYIPEADTFVGNATALEALHKALVDLAGVSEDMLQVDTSITQAMLSPAWAKEAKGNVNVHYTIQIHANDNMGDTRSVTNHLLPSSSDKVTAAITSRMRALGSTALIRAVSLSLRVVPSKD